MSNLLTLISKTQPTELAWNGPVESIVYEEHLIKEKLENLGQPCYFVQTENGIGATNEGVLQVTHQNFGSDYAFQVSSSTEGVTSVSLITTTPLLLLKVALHVGARV